MAFFKARKMKNSQKSKTKNTVEKSQLLVSLPICSFYESVKSIDLTAEKKDIEPPKGR